MAGLLEVSSVTSKRLICMNCGWKVVECPITNGLAAEALAQG